MTKTDRLRRARRIGVFAFVIALVCASSAVAAGAQGSSDPDPGVTDKSVKIGYVAPLTGVASSNWLGADKGCQAVVDAQNAKGGVHGRKIDLEIIDDKSANNLTAVKDLVENRGVFAVVNNSPLGFLSYRYNLENGVPLIGTGIDGNYYGQKGNEDILSTNGNAGPNVGLGYTTGVVIMKAAGAKKIASVAYGSSPSASATAKVTQDYAVPSLGLEPVLTNTALDFGTSDVGPVVLSIKNSGADGVYMATVLATQLAVIDALRQNGVALKALVGPGYGKSLLESPVAKTLDKTAIFQTVQYKPLELKDPATKKMAANLKKVGYTGDPDFGVYKGYVGCDMAITGLEEAGKNPTRRGFIDGIRDLGTYDAAGLTCKPIDVSLETYGKYPTTNCDYAGYIKNGKFVVMNKGKPFIGKLVGSKELLAANAAGVEVTTTTAAPAP